MKKIVLLIMMTTLFLTLTACRKHEIDDAYYARITEDIKEDTLTVTAYNGAGAKSSFALDNSAYDISSAAIDDYIKISVDPDDKIVEVNPIKESDIPENALQKIKSEPPV